MLRGREYIKVEFAGFKEVERSQSKTLKVQDPLKCMACFSSTPNASPDLLQGKKNNKQLNKNKQKPPKKQPCRFLLLSDPNTRRANQQVLRILHLLSGCIQIWLQKCR